MARAERGGTRYAKLSVRMADEYAAAEVRTIVEYEAAARSAHLSQTLIDLVLEEADVDSYPERMRERVAEIEQSIREEAAQRAIDLDEES